jgi:outer membrane protein OmpA-like peptidoglycan-associated protein
MTLNRHFLKWTASALGVFLTLSTPAQTVTPSAQDMIEQLKSSGPRLRGLRNLSVESTSTPVTPPSAATAPSDAVPNPVSTNQNAAPNTASANTASNSSGSSVAAAPRPSLSLLIQFDFNSAQVRPESQQALMNLAVALKAPELIESNFAVEGHTDAKGLAEYNLKLSQQRAEAVQAYLVKQGVAVARLTASGKGATQLANTAQPMSAENRRVRIVNLD